MFKFQKVFLFCTKIIIVVSVKANRGLLNERHQN